MDYNDETYLFEILWNVKNSYNLEEFEFRTLNQSLEESLKLLDFISDYTSFQMGLKIKINFEFFNISSKIDIDENMILISSKSIYNNIPNGEEKESLSLGDIDRMSGDPETLLVFTSANTMVNSFIYHILEKHLKEILNSSNILQLMNTTINHIQGDKQDEN